MYFECWSLHLYSLLVTAPQSKSQQREAVDEVYGSREKLALTVTVKVQVPALDSQAYWGVSWNSLGPQQSHVSKGQEYGLQAALLGLGRKGCTGPRTGESLEQSALAEPSSQGPEEVRRKCESQQGLTYLHWLALSPPREQTSSPFPPIPTPAFLPPRLR